jgi:ABC-type cobalamin transport system ATPase subunit
MPEPLWIYRMALLYCTHLTSCSAMADACDSVSHDQVTRMLQGSWSGHRLFELTQVHTFRGPAHILQGLSMALSPSVLLLDEAFEGLAPVVVQRFAEVVKQIKAMGISVLIAESNLVNATKVADRLYAVDRGEIIFEGAPQAVFDNAEVIKTIRG